MGARCLVPIGSIDPNLSPRPSENMAKNKGLRTSWGWVSGSNRLHRSQSVPTTFGKYGKKQGSPNFMGLGVWFQSVPSVPICPHEVRKIWQKTRVSELHGGWVPGPNRSHRSQSVPTKFGTYCKKQRSPNFMGAWCLVPIGAIGANLSPRSSGNIAKNKSLRTSWRMGVWS